jgi:hypothetical protein
MERIEHLIEKLLEQYLAKLPASKLLITIQMIQNELIGSIKETELLGSEQVSIIVPNVQNFIIENIENKEKQSPTLEESKKVLYELNITNENPDDEEILNNITDEAINEVLKIEEPAEPEKKKTNTIRHSSSQVEFLFSDQKPEVFDPLSDVPTLSQQVQEEEKTTINEKASTENRACSETGRIKDLKKAISINDKFMFINELFRGDEIMYERSIRTINNFSAWIPGEETAEYFESLIKRRFL